MKVFYNTGDIAEHGVMVRSELQQPQQVLPHNEGIEDPVEPNPVVEYEVEEFHLEPGERIIGGTVRCGWMVDGVQFITSHGREFGPYGGLGGSRQDIRCPKVRGVYLSYVKGRVDVSLRDTAIRHLEFVWAYYKFKSEAAPADLAPVNEAKPRVRRPFHSGIPNMDSANPMCRIMP